jgi:hypothetical protein
MSFEIGAFRQGGSKFAIGRDGMSPAFGRPMAEPGTQKPGAWTLDSGFARKPRAPE